MSRIRQGRESKVEGRNPGRDESCAWRSTFAVRRLAIPSQVSGFRSQVSRRAFTLVEVLVSLAIFALAAVVLAGAYVNVLVNFHNMQRSTGERAHVALVRASLLAEADRKRVEEGGEMPLPEGGRVHWQARVEETTVADLFRVNLEIEISPTGPAPIRRESQAFLLLRPGWSEPEKRERLRAASRERLAKLRS
jgi:general secretion pathway protein I